MLSASNPHLAELRPKFNETLRKYLILIFKSQLWLSRLCLSFVSYLQIENKSNILKSLTPHYRLRRFVLSFRKLCVLKLYALLIAYSILCSGIFCFEIFGRKCKKRALIVEKYAHGSPSVATRSSAVFSWSESTLLRLRDYRKRKGWSRHWLHTMNKNGS